MSRPLYFFLFLLFLIFGGANLLITEARAQARTLEIDDKFLARIISLSETGRTVLLNRGEEHGIVVGHHARFSTPQEGYFARAVVVRVSPSRSVWSVYRVIQKDMLKENIVATVKIATEAIVTDDETRSLGLLASDYDQRINEIIPREQEGRPRGNPPGHGTMAPHLSIEDDEEVTSALYGGRDFSHLHSSRFFQRDPGIDWTNLDQAIRVDSSGNRGRRERVDYSTLERR